MPALKPIFPPTNTGPQSVFANKDGFKMVLNNNFSPSSWLLAAAAVQGVITWLFPTVLSFLPALFILGYRVLDMVLIIYGFRQNRYMNGTVGRKTTAQIPDENGDFGDKPSNATVVVLLLGLRTNHPLGIFYPGFQKINTYFVNMMKDLESNREDYGYLTTSSWISSSDRAAGSELLNIYYFRSMEGLLKFAHNPSHSAGVNWWNKTIKEHRDISIMHEVYEAEPGHWENIYENYWPASFASTKYPVKNQTADEKDAAPQQWVNGMVDAATGSLNSSMKRMRRFPSRH
ncbi:hypothetical protein DTO271G3_6819 [Paecilomyces variotii]|nr:hypothetical protein DTO271G3_6819 [Paecilomyces variotii]